MDESLLVEILDCFYKCYNDYEIDRRGDVGSWVREEAMTSLYTYLEMIITEPSVSLIVGADKSEFYERFIQANLQ